MKTQLIGTLSAFLLLFTASTFSQKTEKLSVESSFFTKSDTANWVSVLNDKSLKLSDVFIMDNGIMQVTGQSSGYIRTKKTYSNYELNVEWRWTKSMENNGVLIHIQAKDSVWPPCYQSQLKAGAAGDIICMSGLNAKELTDNVKFTVKKMQPSNEKQLGEWNTMKVVCQDNSLKVYVNGLLQNSLSGLSVTKGFIGFQDEGKPCEFRKLTIQKLCTSNK